MFIVKKMRPKPHFLIRTFDGKIEPDPPLSQDIVEVAQ
jgi:hypothetical protein